MFDTYPKFIKEVSMVSIGFNMSDMGMPSYEVPVLYRLEVTPHNMLMMGSIASQQHYYLL